MNTVLVTGSTGALGRAVVAGLLAEGRTRVVCTSREPHDQGVPVLDVRMPATIAAALEYARPDWVIHLVGTTEGDFAHAFAANVDGTRHLLEAVCAGAAGTRVVVAGSAAEYGIVEAAENPIREDRVLRPVSLYGLTKAWQTQLAGYYAARGVEVMVARIFNLDGPGLSDRLFVGRLQRQIKAVVAGQQCEIACGPLSAVRDYVTTEEAARQVIAIARYGVAGQVYHVGSGRPTTMRKVLERHLAAHGLDVALVREAAELSNRSGYDVPVIYADMNRTEQLPGMGRARGET